MFSSSIQVLRFAFFAFAFTVFLLLSSCDAWTSAQGTIHDNAGNPIPAAIVTLRIGSNSREFRSAEDGRFMVSMSQPPWKTDVILTASKPGYVSIAKQFKGPGRFQDFDLVLKPVREEPIDAPQRIAKAMFPDAPNNIHDIRCFRSLTFKMSINDVVQKCGRPDGEFGSGIYIFVWNMGDGSSVSIGTPHLESIGDVRLTDASGKTSFLLKRK